MHIVDRPSQLPGVCIVSNTDNDARFIDTGATRTMFDGHIYVCEKSVQEMARLLSYETPDSNTTQYDFALLQSVQISLDAAEMYHRESLDHLRAIRARINARYGPLLAEQQPAREDPPASDESPERFVVKFESSRSQDSTSSEAEGRADSDSSGSSDGGKSVGVSSNSTDG